MKKLLSIIITVVLVIVAMTLLTFSSKFFSQPTKEDQVYSEAFARNYKMFSVAIPEKLDFAGEPVPIDKYYVRESMDRELLVNSYWHSNTILMFKRAYRWLPVIKPILKKNGIPEDFVYLCMIESAFENVVSPAGASGYWQLMKTTAKSYGLEISEEVDERYHVEKATEAACKFIKEAYAKFGTWTLAAAAYNMGLDGLDKQLNTEKTDNYYDLQLNKESIRYIYRVIAVKTIFNNPVRYGLYLREKDLYPPIPTQVITVDSTIADLADFAKKNSVPYRVLKELNPWLLRNTLTVTNQKKYDILIPKDGKISYEILMELFRQDSLFFNDTLRIDHIN